MLFVDWPVWSQRTGTTTITANSTDPFDDGVRIVNHTAAYIDPDTDPSGHAAATIQNYPLGTGTANQLYPHSVNPLRTVGGSLSFGGMGLRVRRLNNQATEGNSPPVDPLDGSNSSAGWDYRTLSIADQNLDVNHWNAGHKIFARIGYNLCVSYAHFHSIIGLEGSAAFSAINSDSNSSNPVYFVGADGKCRAYSLTVDEDLHLYLAQQEWARGPQTSPQPSDPLSGSQISAHDDRLYFNFVGTPPSPDVIPILPMIQKEGPLRDAALGVSSATANVNTASEAKKRDLAVQAKIDIDQVFRAGYVVGQQNRTVPVNLSAGANPQQDRSQILGRFDIEERIAYWSGDSGTPVITPTHLGPAYLGMIAAFSPNDTNILDDLEVKELVDFAGTTAGADLRDSNGDHLIKGIYAREVPKFDAFTGPIKPKRTEVAARVPTAAQLEVGELAINSTDKAIFTKKANGSIVTLVPGYSLATQILLAGTTAADHRTALGLGPFATAPTANGSYTGFIEAPQSTTDYVLDAASAGPKTLVTLRHKCSTASGTVSVVRGEADGTETVLFQNPPATTTTLISSAFTANSNVLGSGRRLLLRFSTSSVQDFEFTIAYTVTS